MDLRGGITGKVGDRTLLDASVETSNFDSEASELTFPFRAPAGTRRLYSWPSSRSQLVSGQVYSGGENFDVLARYASLGRRNADLVGDLRGSYLQVGAAGYPTDNLLLREASYAWPGTPGANLVARGGSSQTRRSFQGGAPPTADRRFYSLRATVRPLDRVRLGLGYRNDQTDDPYYIVEAARNRVFDAYLNYTPSPDAFVSARYVTRRAGNDQSQSNTDEFSLYGSARFRLVRPGPPTPA